jgi:hypothetical protein
MTRNHAELLSAYFDENLTPEEAVELRAWLDAHPANWRTFVRESVIHSRLRDVLMQHDMQSLVFDEAFVDTIDPQRIASLLDEEEAKVARRQLEAAERAEREAHAAARRQELLDRKSLRIERPRSSQGLVYAGVAAAAALLMIAFRVFAPSPAPGPVATPAVPIAAAEVPAAPPVIAEIANAFDAKLRREDQSLAVGAKLPPGSVTIDQGVAEVRFASGVTIVIEGPSEVNLLTADRAKLVRGKSVVRVPPQAVGFTLQSDAAAFVDLGTEFAVEIDEPGRASIHVLDGEVAFVAGKGGNPSRTLQRGAATRVNSDGTTSDVEFDDAKFVRRVPASAYELAVLKSGPLAYWRLDRAEPGDQLTSEGRLALPSFVKPGMATIDNRDQQAVGNCPAYSVRFQGQHEGIEIPGDAALGMASNCTYEAWVCPAAASGPQRIFSTFDRPHSGMAFGVVDGRWYKMPSEELKLHLTLYGKYDCVSAVPIKEGNWIHVAATVDAAGTPALYVDGAAVGQRFRPLNEGQDDGVAVEWVASKETPVGVPTGGRARIGRNPPGALNEIARECWQGAISNVAVYDRALEADEIRRHYAATRDKQTDHGSRSDAESREAAQSSKATE